MRKQNRADQAKTDLAIMLPGFLRIEPLNVRRAFNVPTAYKVSEDGIAQDYSIVLEDSTKGLVTYYEWDSGRREVRSEKILDLDLKWPRPWEPLCMLVEKVRYKDAFYHRAAVELLVHPTEPNSWAQLRDEPVRTGPVPTGPDVFSILGNLGVQHWVKEHQLPDHTGKPYSNRLYALFALNDKQGPAMLYAITRYNPGALDNCPWPNEQFDLFG